MHGGIRQRGRGTAGDGDETRAAQGPQRAVLAARRRQEETGGEGIQRSKAETRLHQQEGAEETVPLAAFRVACVARERNHLRDQEASYPQGKREVWGRGRGASLKPSARSL